MRMSLTSTNSELWNQSIALTVLSPLSSLSLTLTMFPRYVFDTKIDINNTV